MTIVHGDDELSDPVEKMLKETGCLELHYKVQECIAETHDWRKCQQPVNDFRKCVEDYNIRKKSEQNNGRFSM